MKLENIPAVLLVGGERHAPASGSFVEAKASGSYRKYSVSCSCWLCSCAHKVYSRMIMSAGHLADQIEETFGDGGRWNARHSIFEGIATVWEQREL